MKLNGYDITGITDDTRSIKAGYAFVAIKGENFDGHTAAEEALLQKKAAVVIVERDLGLEKQIVVSDTRSAFAEFSSLFYGKPTEKLKLIAVTGTNGKSTIATLIKHVLDNSGHKTGFIGTINYDVCRSDGEVYEAKLSTPRQNELYSLFAEMVENKAEFCVMEASSQALSQKRIAGEKFELGIFTNLTQDHLDWHKTMENYYQAKKSLFEMCKKALICIDDDYGKRLYKELSEENNENNIEVFSYGANNCSDFYAVNIKTSSAGISYWLSASKEEQTFKVNFGMPGLFNVANTTAVIAACSILGFDLRNIIEILEKSAGVRGRSEAVYRGEFTVICDYAHTEDALIKILTSTREYAKKRIICLFGAAGERDAAKRPAMGASVAKLSDYVIITSDNPRFESPEAIIEQVKSGLIELDTPCETYVDRREAIVRALDEAEENDIVLLCGKGHETYQVIGDDYQPFDERKIVAEIMEARQKKS